MFLKVAAQAFAPGEFINIFLRFLGFWGSFSIKSFSYIKKRVSCYSYNSDVPTVYHFSSIQLKLKQFRNSPDILSCDLIPHFDG